MPFRQPACDGVPIMSAVTAMARLLALVGAIAALAAVEANATCQPVAGRTPLLKPAAFAPAAVKPNFVRITFIGHASFEIESPEGVKIVTDYNAYIRAPRPPDIITMNNSHDSHFTSLVDPAIPHVLRGWDPAGEIARHNVRLKDVHVRNVPTNLAESGGRWSNGNSMFAIEVVGLCLVHISHLHHVLSKEQLADLGRIDIAFAPIDGMWTMSHQELFEVLDQIKPTLIIPMHYGSWQGTQLFVQRASEKWKVGRHDSPTLEISSRDLPSRTEVLFLQGH
jgi:L-ascorbate metabolism protein UlaG (beta-lactamase superfamily)